MWFGQNRRHQAGSGTSQELRHWICRNFSQDQTGKQKWTDFVDYLSFSCKFKVNNYAAEDVSFSEVSDWYFYFFFLPRIPHTRRELRMLFTPWSGRSVIIAWRNSTAGRTGNRVVLESPVKSCDQEKHQLSRDSLQAHWPAAENFTHTHLWLKNFVMWSNFSSPFNHVDWNRPWQWSFFCIGPPAG